jgi:drug/metabolite transporter (DMT)-like permease
MPLAVFVALTWAVNLILTKIYIQGVPLPAFVFIKMAAATLYHVMFFPFDHSPFTRRGVVFSLISAVLLSVSDIMLMVGVRGLPATIFSPVFATVIPFGFILSVILLKEKPVRRNWAGMLLIFAAAAICGYYGAR